MTAAAAAPALSALKSPLGQAILAATGDHQRAAEIEDWLVNCSSEPMDLSGLPPLADLAELCVDGCTGLTALPDLPAVVELYYGAPAPWLSTSRLPKGAALRPIVADREYWSERLGLALGGCYEEIFAEIADQKDAILKRADLEPWELVAIREFRG
ncbi:MAG: hypothetical protein AAGN46_01345 [Acidobacteriota bacterium]